MKAAKFVLFPNTADASPRLLAEAIVRGVPVVVNENIYGGWKYIEPDNGRFFKGFDIEDYINNRYSGENEVSLEKAMIDVMKLDRTKVENTFYSEWGFVNASKRLAQILNDQNRTHYKAVAFEEWKSQLSTIFRKRESL
jgi:glycosyltransferase involved in cell wall biosynthesis